ncbi:MAG: GRAS family protein, partial [Spirochaetes bacterium]|nr:GRAS family protein [Spirochaetota bacterium]
MRFETSYQKFIEICQDMLNNKDSEAKKAINQFILEHVDVHTTNEKLFSHILATSLLKRVDRQLLETKNIYLQQFDIPQIVLFYKMAEAYPQVNMSHHIANQYLESKLVHLKKAAIFDIGIGKGKQIGDLLKTAIEKKYPLEEVNVIGLDPDINNINDSAKVFEELAKEADFTIRFHPYTDFLENFTEKDFNKIKELGNGALFINSAFSMHHIAHPLHDTEKRTEIFKKLAQLKPLLFTLAEPNSDHDVEKISKRLHNCWQHFSIVFDLIDEANIEPVHKFMIKE